jgi:hypothetical protein
VVLAVCLLLAHPAAGWAEDRQQPDADAWVAAMKEVHSRFHGQKGTFATFGDSITVSMAFWAPLAHEHKNLSPEGEAAYKLVKEHMREECWGKWRGPEHGNEGGMTIRWADENVGRWLKKLNPEVALIMFGTNDLGTVPLGEYERKTRTVVQRCLDNGTVVILTTIPPRAGLAEKAAEYAAAARHVARELKVPLCDYHAACLKRRPRDWNGADEKFKEYKDYDVPTLIARDGVHPSYPKKYQGDYSAEALARSGYGLRSYVTLLSYGEVIRKVLREKEK